MRIVGGAFGGRRLRAPGGRHARPTTERAREGIASALEARGLVLEARVLDLYAGSGALGLEMLSRGARSLVAVDRDRLARRSLAETAATLGLAERVQVLGLDLEERSRRWIRALRTHGPFDLVLADPPWNRLAAVSGVLAALLEDHLLSERARIVVEHPSRTSPQWPEALQSEARYRYGDTAVTLLAPEPQR
ncbi:MAG: RsmD family RNA methyltransferase [Myxococcales bacterium]|nr:RsmD family RNA methyltransferase [Myxococcales bacterium]